jgi:hypothetical protein
MTPTLKDLEALRALLLAAMWKVLLDLLRMPAQAVATEYLRRYKEAHPGETELPPLVVSCEARTGRVLIDAVSPARRLYDSAAAPDGPSLESFTTTRRQSKTVRHLS